MRALDGGGANRSESAREEANRMLRRSAGLALGGALAVALGLVTRWLLARL